jgi:cysteine-rich secretory family protein
MRSLIIAAFAAIAGAVAVAVPAAEAKAIADTTTAAANVIPVTGGVPIINQVNTYRQRAGLASLSWNQNLAVNAWNTGVNNTIEKDYYHPHHILFPGSYAQVIAEGFDDSTVCGANLQGFTPFLFSLLAWLCESPSDPGIAWSCTVAARISHQSSSGEIGHWQIFHSPAYNQIGCAYVPWNIANCADFVVGPWTGFWVCDFAP